ncbi:MAG: hypothetical protein ABSE45_13090, partial [Candidatus Acidiferrales bacterium]
STSSSSGGPTATFLQTDTTTEGTWIGTYGSDGSAIATVNPQTIPSYVSSLSFVSPATWTWAASTTDNRATETGFGTARTAATWYTTSFYIDLNFSDTNTHQVAVYAVDWDGEGRSETVQITNASTGAQLDIRTLSNFGNGAYLVWNISGHVRINISKVTGNNAVVSGVFLRRKSLGPKLKPIRHA